MRIHRPRLQIIEAAAQLANMPPPQSATLGFHLLATTRTFIMLRVGG